MVNITDRDQEQSDLILHCLLRPFCLNIQGKYDRRFKVQKQTMEIHKKNILKNVLYLF